MSAKVNLNFTEGQEETQVQLGGGQKKHENAAEAKMMLDDL